MNSTWASSSIKQISITPSANIFVLTMDRLPRFGVLPGLYSHSAFRATSRYWHLGVAIGVVACAPTMVPVRTIAPNAVVDSTGARIIVQANAAPEKVTPIVVQFMVDVGWPVSGAQAGIIEAKLPPQMGFTATYDITIRGYVTPTPTGSRVVLQAEERRESGRYTPTVSPITKANQGRSGEVWKKLEALGVKVAEAFRSPQGG